MAEKILTFFMRMICGIIAIYFINLLLRYFGVALLVGINPFTVLTSGFLGIPGLALLYGLGVYYSL
ncbi:MAG: pro-sigmaK processing inhibitor BofA family protein [Acetatifactor sp.]